MNENIQKIIHDLGLGGELNHLSEEEQQIRILHALRIWIQIQENQHREHPRLFSHSYVLHSQPSLYSVQSSPLFDNPVDEFLPNGHRRDEYYQYGYNDYDISCWGLDQYGAPSPSMAGAVILVMLDGDLDGHFGFRIPRHRLYRFISKDSIFIWTSELPHLVHLCKHQTI